LRQPETPDTPDRRAARWIVHFVAYHPRRTVGSVPHVDGSWKTAGVRVSLRTGTAPRRCYLAPDRVPLHFVFDGGYATVDLPDIGTHTVLVME